MKKSIIIGTIGIISIFLLLLMFNSITGKNIQGDNSADIEISVNAFRFGYSPNLITVKSGDLVKITINNTDTKHGIRIPDLGISGEETIEFIAETPGEYIWYCFVPCGSGHREMQGKIIIE